ncbi:hypothetical protein BV210_02425 [Halorientalis sp. IM1011]|uniref:hypothetical protein n=1 Tax=Halorientalis sp. IM1011 TaxID=1932360 RepID=UPI00097CC5DA|nr:hypothetical protein [Halorientalis sp. IM1011]AQL41639.1 hypothetical protein BV210_02425 [Halorientalis sp. IM1011]
MGWLEKQVEQGINNVLTQIKNEVLDLAESIFADILEPIVGVPAPTSDTRYVVVGSPDNQPWQSIYQDTYLPYILPLTIMLLIGAVAYIGLRAGSLSEYRRKKLLRRVGLVFMGAFVWFPIVSIPLQLVNAMGIHLAPIDSMASGFAEIGKAGLGGVFAVLVVVLLENFLLLIAAVVYALRWWGVVILTAAMPLLGVAWAMEAWPLNSFANIAKRAAGIYPGLVIAGLPAALLFRIGWSTDIGAGVSGLFTLFLNLALIPAACIVSILTVYWSSSTIQRVSRVGARAASKAAPRAARGAKSGTGKSVRGARNVHRGYSKNAAGAVSGNGQTTIGSGGSKAYKAGSSVQGAKTHAKRYNNLRKSKSGRMRDKAKSDLSRAGKGAKVRSKQALRKTKNKVSRW